MKHLVHDFCGVVIICHTWFVDWPFNIIFSIKEFCFIIYPEKSLYEISKAISYWRMSHFKLFWCMFSRTIYQPQFVFDVSHDVYILQWTIIMVIQMLFVFAVIFQLVIIELIFGCVNYTWSLCGSIIISIRNEFKNIVLWFKEI